MADLNPRDRTNEIMEKVTDRLTESDDLSEDFTAHEFTPEQSNEYDSHVLLTGQEDDQYCYLVSIKKIEL